MTEKNEAIYNHEVEQDRVIELVRGRTHDLAEGVMKMQGTLERILIEVTATNGRVKDQEDRLRNVADWKTAHQHSYGHDGTRAEITRLELRMDKQDAVIDAVERAIGAINNKVAYAAGGGATLGAFVAIFVPWALTRLAGG